MIVVIRNHEIVETAKDGTPVDELETRHPDFSAIFHQDDGADLDMCAWTGSEHGPSGSAGTHANCPRCGGYE